MVSSFILNPDYFNLPENNELARESGIENRYNRAFENVDPNFSVNKDDWSDGVIRYTLNDEIRFYGVQECKVHNKRGSLESRIVQNLVYVHDWIIKFPELKSKFKFIILPTEKEICIIYLDDILNSVFWTEFCFYYKEHRLDKGHSASNFYKLNRDVRALIFDYINRFRKSYRLVGTKLDFKKVVEEILENCL